MMIPFEQIDNKSGKAIGTIELLLQQHHALLIRGIVSQTVFRVINAVLAILLSVSGRAYLVPVIVLLISALISGFWWSERRFVAKSVARVEKMLGKTGRLEFDDVYIAYRFHESTNQDSFPLLRFEPLLWFAA